MTDDNVVMGVNVFLSKRFRNERTIVVGFDDSLVRSRSMLSRTKLTVRSEDNSPSFPAMVQISVASIRDIESAIKLLLSDVGQNGQLSAFEAESEMLAKGFLVESAALSLGLQYLRVARERALSDASLDRTFDATLSNSRVFASSNAHRASSDHRNLMRRLMRGRGSSFSATL